MSKPVAKMTDVHREFVVRELASYSTPSEAATALREATGIEITPQSAERYDPTKYAGRGLSQKWRIKFDLYRKAFKEQIEDIPIANRAVRLKKLAKAAAAFEQRGNYIAMADVLERAAKEVGNVHTNRREHTGANGKPLQFEDVGAMTPEQISQELKALTAEPAAKAFLLGLMGNEEAAPIPAPQAQETKNGTKAKGR